MSAIETPSILQRIHAYLAMGGLFNPELANHDRVRELIMDCRSALTAANNKLAAYQSVEVPEEPFCWYIVGPDITGEWVTVYSEDESKPRGEGWYPLYTDSAYRALAVRMREAERDAVRIDWLESLFGKSWNGVIGSGSHTNWMLSGTYRHAVAKMEGATFRAAIDAALDAAGGKS